MHGTGAAKWHSCAKWWFRSCETPFEMAPRQRRHLIRSQLVSQLIHVLSMVPDSGAILILVQLVSLDCGPQKGVINKIYNLLHHVLG